jgi:hypothetical protein
METAIFNIDSQELYSANILLWNLRKTLQQNSYYDYLQNGKKKKTVLVV